MEVHAHAHTQRNKWTHYFWEFLMLFLAVFCGFLAEYQLEHKIERDRAKELAKSFYEELKGDSINVAIKVQSRIKQEKALISLMKYFKDSSLIHVSKTFVLNFLYGINFRTPSLFDQLKNSGSLRYFKSNDLQKLIGELSVAIHNINDRQALESAVRIEYINPLIVRHYDYDFDMQLSRDYDISVIKAAAEYELTNEVIPFQFKAREKLDRQITINALGFYGRAGVASTRLIHYNRYIELNTELLKVLRKEYHLK